MLPKAAAAPAVGRRARGARVARNHPPDAHLVRPAGAPPPAVHRRAHAAADAAACGRARARGGGGRRGAQGRRPQPRARAVRGGAGRAGGRSRAGAPARHDRRQAAGHAGPPGQRRALARPSPASWTRWSRSGSPRRCSAETLYAAHYRVPDLPTIVDLPEVPERPLRVGRRGAPAALPRRQPAGGDQPPVRAPPARRHR